MEITGANSNYRRLAALSFGALLWLQIPAAALSRELEWEQIDRSRVVLYLTPLVLVFLSWLLRHPLVALFMFPVSLASVLAVHPEGPGGLLASDAELVLAVATLLAYVVSAGAWLRSDSPASLLVHRESLPIKEDRWRPLRGTFLPRAVILVAAFLLTAVAVSLYDPLREQVVASFQRPDGPLSGVKGILLYSLLLFFLWCIYAYAFFILPTQEQRQRQRHLELHMRAHRYRLKTLRFKLELVVVAVFVAGLVGLLVLARTR